MVGRVGCYSYNKIVSVDGVYKTPWIVVHTSGDTHLYVGKVFKRECGTSPDLTWW
jgi:hypothetical protein